MYKQIQQAGMQKQKTKIVKNKENTSFEYNQIFVDKMKQLKLRSTKKNWRNSNSFFSLNVFIPTVGLETKKLYFSDKYFETQNNQLLHTMSD